MTKVCWLFFVLTPIYSCSNIPEYANKVEALPVGDTLQGKIISLDAETEFLNMRQIENINDEYLVIIEEREKDIFKVFNLPDFKFLYKWGRRGRGPGELSSVIRTIDTRTNQLVICEPALFKLKFYEVTETELVYIKELPLGYATQQMPLNGLKRLSDSVYVALYDLTGFLDTDHEFIALKPGNINPLFTFGKYPESQLTGMVRAQEYIKATAAKPDGSKFIAFYMYHPTFRIFDNKGSLLKEIKIDDPFSSFDTKSKIYYRNFVQASNDYIYVLAPNTIREELSRETYRPLIEIWDWNGRPLYRFMLDKPVHDFVIAAKYGKLYGVSYRNGNPSFYEYELPN